MNYAAAAKKYASVNAQAAIGEASPHQLINMLLSGAIDRIIQAKGCLEYKDMNRKGICVAKAVNIIGGLMGSLDKEKGGEIAENLDRLYDYMCRRLLEGHAKNDPKMFDEVVALLREVKEGWDGIASH